MSRRRITQINPVDTQDRVAVGVQIPFSSKGVFIKTFTTAQAVKVNLINALLTGNKERYLNPNIGTPLREELFNNMNNERGEDIKFIIRNIIQERFPRIEVVTLDLINIEEENTLQLVLNYRILNTNIEDTLVVSFDQ